jgi:hypothetical protein
MNVDAAPVPTSQLQIYQIPSFQSNPSMNPSNAWNSGAQVYAQLDSSGTNFLSPQTNTNMVFVPTSSLAQPQMINSSHQAPVQVFQMQVTQPTQLDSSLFYGTQFAVQTPQQPSLEPPTLLSASGPSNSKGLISSSIVDCNDLKGKRKRSAFVEELRFCGMYKDSNFIRVWMDSFGKVFYDCICGGRKGVQDIKKIERHIATHQVAKHKCDECGKSFSRYLQLNAHKRVHRNKNGTPEKSNTQDSALDHNANGTARRSAAVEEDLDEQMNDGD